jgi:hypothetical protein
MEKRSRRCIRDLVALPAQNEIGCARISMMARNTNVPLKGRIQKRKTHYLQIITFGLQRAAGPYRRASWRHHSAYSIALSGSQAAATEAIGRMSWWSRFEGLACRRSVPLACIALPFICNERRS